MPELIQELQENRVDVDPEYALAFAKETGKSKGSLPDKLNLDPKKVEQGLAKLVLSLVELIRQLLEKQAMRRIEHGSVTDEEVERMGETFMKLEEKIIELRKAFNLDEDDLNISLGPIQDVE